MATVTVQFSTMNDPYVRYAIVCADKQWGSPGCQPWTGDWVSTCYQGTQCTATVNANRYVTVVTSADGGYTWDADVYVNGQLIQHCSGIDRNHPCVVQVPAATPPPPPPPTQTVAPPSGKALPEWAKYVVIGAIVAIPAVAIAVAASRKK
ncbi:MAG: hypothetical protein ACP5I3_10595 [Thermoproteus sp.]